MLRVLAWRPWRSPDGLIVLRKRDVMSYEDQRLLSETRFMRPTLGVERVELRARLEVRGDHRPAIERFGFGFGTPRARPGLREPAVLAIRVHAAGGDQESEEKGAVHAPLGATGRNVTSARRFPEISVEARPGARGLGSRIVSGDDA